MGLIEHWWCPACGTFDGPHDEGFCDVCAEGPGGGTPQVEGLVQREQLRRVVKALEADLLVWEQLREQLSDTTPMHALLGLRIAAIRATLGGE